MAVLRDDHEHADFGDLGRVQVGAAIQAREPFVVDFQDGGGIIALTRRERRIGRKVLEFSPCVGRDFAALGPRGVQEVALEVLGRRREFSSALLKPLVEVIALFDDAFADVLEGSSDVRVERLFCQVERFVLTACDVATIEALESDQVVRWEPESAPWMG